MKKNSVLLTFILLISILASCGQLQPEPKEISDANPSYLKILLRELEIMLNEFGESTTRNEEGRTIERVYD